MRPSPANPMDTAASRKSPWRFRCPSGFGDAGAKNVLEGLFRLALGLLPVGLVIWVNSPTGWLVFGCTMMVLAAVAVARDELAGRLQRGLATTHNGLARQIDLLRDEVAGLAETPKAFAAVAAELKAAVEREQAREPCGYKRDWMADHPARWMNPNA